MPHFLKRSVIREDALKIRHAMEAIDASPVVADWDMHVTQFYSNDKFDIDVDTSVITVSLGSPSIAHLGDKGALVVKFKDKGLSSRFDEIVKSGGVPTHDAYIPHITVSWMAENVDPASIDLSGFPKSVRLGPEVLKNTDEDWMPEMVDHFATGAAEILEFSSVLPGVEIFRKGEWKGRTYSSADLDSIVDSFDPLDFRPPVKLGHDEDPKAPAYGWITSIKRVGDTIVADFDDVPDELIDQIKEGRYDSVSSEIFLNYSRNGGKKYPARLAAVAVLGAHPPGVGGLKPLRSSLATLHESDAERVTAMEIVAVADKPNNPAPDNTTGSSVDSEARLAAMEAQLAKYNEIVSENDTLKTQLSEAQSKIENDTSALELQTMHERMGQLEKIAKAAVLAERTQKIDQLTQSCRLPHIRPHITALAELAFTGDSNEPKVVKFTADGSANTKETPLIDVFSDMIKRLNGGAAKLFEVVSDNPDFDAARNRPVGATGSQQAGDVLDGLATEFAREKRISYAEAFATVTENPENAELVASYQRSDVG